MCFSAFLQVELEKLTWSEALGEGSLTTSSVKLDLSAKPGMSVKSESESKSKSERERERERGERGERREERRDER